MVYDNDRPVSILLMSVLLLLPNSNETTIKTYILLQTRKPYLATFIALFTLNLTLTLTSKRDPDSAKVNGEPACQITRS